MRDLIYLGTAKIVQVLLGLITIRLITEMLTPSDVGVYYILITLTSLLSFGFYNPLGQFYSRHIISWKIKGKIKTATLLIIVLRMLMIPIALLVAIVFFYIFDYGKYFNLWEYALYILISLVALTYGLLISTVNIVCDRVTFSKCTLLTLIISTFSACVCIYINHSAISWLYGLAIPQILFCFFLYKLVVRNYSFSIEHIKKSINLNYFKRTAIFVLPVTITLFLQWGQKTSYRLFIEDIYSAKSLGFIAVGISISGAIFSAVESLSTQYYLPDYYKKITGAKKEDRGIAWNSIANMMLPIYISLLGYVIVFSPYIIKILISNSFSNIALYVGLGAIIELFRVSINLLYLISQSEINTSKTILPYLIGYIFLIIELYIIKPYHHIWLVPITLIISNFITLLVMRFNMRKLLMINVDYGIIIKSIILMLPYGSIYLFNIKVSYLSSFVVLSISATYFMLTQFIIFKKLSKRI